MTEREEETGERGCGEVVYPILYSMESCKFVRELLFLVLFFS